MSSIQDLMTWCPELLAATVTLNLKLRAVPLPALPANGSLWLWPLLRKIECGGQGCRKLDAGS
jgi:hypothetical protein